MKCFLVIPAVCPFLKVLFILLLFRSLALCEFTYPGCSPLSAQDFRADILFDVTDQIWEPNKLDFDQQEDGTIDIFFTQVRTSDMGRFIVKKWDASLDEISILWEEDMTDTQDEKVCGLALDPAFKQNGWIFASFAQDHEWAIRRFTYEDGVIDPASDTKIFSHWRIGDVPTMAHSGSGMRFDAYGDLWFAVGDNTAGAAGPANTHDIRGGIGRIRPLPVPEGTAVAGPGLTYTIPAGNLGQYYSEYYAARGNAPRAAEFLDTSRVMQEIYVMGSRNAYAMHVDPVRRWLTWGDCGPDGFGNTEEHNFTTIPGNFGWPYFSGENKEIGGMYDGGGFSGGPDAPRNESRLNTGLIDLPPAIPAMHTYLQNCAIAVHIAKHDPAVSNPGQMPPHLHNVWLYSDWTTSRIWGSYMTADGTATTSQELLNDNIFSTFAADISRPIDIRQGPDGALYVINYSGWDSVTPKTSVMRIEYAGPACAVTPDFKADKAGCMDAGSPGFDPDATHPLPGACTGISVSDRGKIPDLDINFEKGMVSIAKAGAHSITVSDIKGREVFSHTGAGAGTFSLARRIEPGVYTLQVSLNGNSHSRKFAYTGN